MTQNPIYQSKCYATTWESLNMYRNNFQTQEKTKSTNQIAQELKNVKINKDVPFWLFTQNYSNILLMLVSYVFELVATLK